MNKTAIEWCDYTWNPVTGCLHGCPYCYARKIAERFKGSKAWPNGFKPMFHAERLNDPMKMKKPQSIFVCSMADLFGEWVPDLWIHAVFDEIRKAPQHTYIFLTKAPSRYLTIPGDYIKDNCWFGATVTDQVSANQRIHWLQRLPEGNTFISYEPLLGKLTSVNIAGIRQVVLGAQTNPTVEPDRFSITLIEQEAEYVGAKVFCKDSLAYLQGDDFKRDLAWRIK
jgi:protein gp37